MRQARFVTSFLPVWWKQSSKPVVRFAATTHKSGGGQTAELKESGEAMSSIGISAKFDQEEAAADLFTETAQYPPIIPHPDDRFSPAALKFERDEISKIVQGLPIVQEKIDFVNPYERPWSPTEIKWHRKNRPPLFSPRKAFRVHAVPNAYNLLKFHKFITRTHVIDGRPPKFYDYDQDNISDVKIMELDDLYREDMCALEEEEKARLEAEAEDPMTLQEKSEANSRQLSVKMEQLMQRVWQLYLAEKPHLRTAQVSRDARNEAFWVRGGFMSLYDQEKLADPLKRGAVRKLTGDDRRRLGEMAFCYREKPAIEIRTEQPLPPLVDTREELCRWKVDPWVYPLVTLGVWPEGEPLWQTAGTEPGLGDPCNYGLLSVMDGSLISDRITSWGPLDAKEVQELWISTGLMASFGWLVAQAHSLGFTQFNDLSEPLVSQVVVTHGSDWHFFCYQLNTLNLMNHWEEEDALTNLCWHWGPKTMEEAKKDSALRNLLRFALRS